MNPRSPMSKPQLPPIQTVSPSPSSTLRSPASISRTVPPEISVKVTSGTPVTSPRLMPYWTSSEVPLADSSSTTLMTAAAAPATAWSALLPVLISTRSMACRGSMLRSVPSEPRPGASARFTSAALCRRLPFTRTTS